MPHGGPPPSGMSMPPSADVGQMMQELAAGKSSADPKQAQAMQQAMGAQAGGAAGVAQPKPPRPVGSFKDEAERFVGDISDELLSLIFGTLGLKRKPKTQEELAELQKFHQGWQQLDMEQQQVAHLRIQEEMQRKEMLRQEDEMKAAQKAQEKQHQDVSVPTGKQTGMDPVAKLQQDRKTLSSSG